MIKTAKELVAACLDAVHNHKTLYVMGCFGAPMTEKNKTRYINSYSFNRKAERAAKIRAASADTFGFDCVCFIKALFWGWKGDPNQVYGGAQYKSNGVPDIGADAMLRACTDVSTDFSTVVPGEFVWLPGHCGIYIGDGMAVEATDTDEDGVQIQAVLPMGVKPGMPATGWKKHGKLPWISYENAEEPVEPVEPAAPEKLYRVTVEGLPKGHADNLAKTYTDTGYTVRVEEMEAELVPEEQPAEPAPAPTPAEPAWEPQEGDIVQFKGGMQYSNSGATVGSERPAGLAKITKTAPGKAHPWHLVKTGSVGPYGWVDRDTFEKA